MAKSKQVNKCKHEFTHVTVSGWWGAGVIIYCKKCGVDADSIHLRGIGRLLRQ